MAYIPGGTLRDQMDKAGKAQPLPFRRAAALLAPIARALAYALVDALQKKLEDLGCTVTYEPGNMIVATARMTLITISGKRVKIPPFPQRRNRTGTGHGPLSLLCGIPEPE
jgi:hypothetical protein